MNLLAILLSIAKLKVDLPEGHDVVGGPAEYEAGHQGPRQLDGLHLGSTNHTLP